MEDHDLLRDVRLESLVVVGKGRELVGHDDKTQV